MGAWELRKLTDLAEYINGYAFGPDDWGAEGLPIIRIEQLKNPNAPADYYSGNLPEKNIISEGDLIFSWSASLFLRIWQNGRAALNQHLFKVVEKPNVDREFLKSFIEFYLPQLTKASHGSTMQHITRKELDKLSANFPIDKAEQEIIATVIATLDRAIEQTEALIAKQQRIKTGLMQDLLTKGIDEHGNIRSEATHAFKDSPLGWIPVEWSISKLSALTTKIVDGVHHTPVYVETGVPFLTITDLTGSEGISFDNVRYVTKSDHEAFILRADPTAGDVLVTKDGTLGVARIVPDDCPIFSIFVSVAQLRPKKDICTPELIWSFFESGEFKIQLGALSAGTGLAHIHLEHFREFLLRVPSIDEQGRIFSVIAKHYTEMRTISVGLAKLRAIKKGVISDLLSGERRVTPLLAQAATQ